MIARFNITPTVLLILFFSFYCSTANAENSKIDSLKAVLATVENDTTKIQLLNNLGHLYNNINRDAAIRYFEEAVKYSDQMNWMKGAAENESMLGHCYFVKAMYSKSLEHRLKALKLFEEMGSVEGIATTLHSIGGVYHIQKDGKKAIHYYKLAADKFDAIGKVIGTASSYANVSALYQETDENDSALYYAKKTLDLAAKAKDTMLMCVAYTTMGNVHLSKGEYDISLRDFSAVLGLSEKGNLPIYTANTEGNIGLMYLTILEDTTLTGQQRNRYIGSEAAGLAKAISYMERAIEGFSALEYTESVMAFSKEITRAYRKAGDYANALKSYELYITLRDSAFSDDSKVQIAQQTAKHEEELKQKQIQLNTVLNKKKTEERWFFAGSLALLLIVGGVVTKSLLSTRTANQKLVTEKQKTDKLNTRQAELLQQKDLLMREIHHRVKNNLQVISALLDLQLNNIDDNIARNAMAESTSRVRSISLIHEQLYMDEDITSIEFSAFTQKLFRQVSSLFANGRQEITLHNEVKELPLDIDTAVPLGLMLNELMTNSYKYAFEGDENGTISIQIAQNNGLYGLRYKDSGPGLPDGATAKNGSLGMRLLRILSIQLGGSFMYDAATKSSIIMFKDLLSRKLED